jgi:hypothetical protein
MNKIQNLHDSLDGARLIRVSVGHNEIAAWFGGDLVHLLDTNLEFVDAFSLGKTENPNNVKVHDVMHALADSWSCS